MTHRISGKFDLPDIRHIPSICGPTDKLIESFLNRKQYVCLNGCKSTLKLINYGVAQGSKISPLLFLIYVNGLPSSVRCVPRLFTDDTCLLLADSNLNSLFENMNNELINLCHWCEANELSVNPIQCDDNLPKAMQHIPYTTTPLL